MKYAIVPVEADKPMRDAMLENHKSFAKWKAGVAASPHAGKVSPAQHRAAMVALQNSKWSFMPAAQRSEIIDIVIAAFGLEKAE